ncbi:MAG: MFS transporter [Mycobacteriales bacterium]
MADRTEAPSRAGPGPWAPLRRPVFRALWIAQATSFLGTWMQTVGAQWFLTERSASATAVAAVQTATSLPVLLLALPSGVLADLVDRRRVLIGSTVAATAVAVLLTALTVADRLSSAGLLGLTALLGVTSALTIPAWQATQPELVPRDELPAAAALNGVSMNIARAIGPAVGGLIVAAGGPAWVFGLNAVSFLAVAGVVAGRLRPADPVRREAERLGAAMRAGLSYVRFAPVLRRILLRAGLWALPATALWALLPVVAAERLGLGSGGYGLLLGALGTGALGGAVLLGRVDLRRWPNRLTAGCSLLYAATMAILALTSSPVLAFAVLLLAGACWLAVLSTLNALAQLVLPAWVRARALATYTVVFFGGQAAGGLLWGAVADVTSVPAALLGAAAGLVLTGLTVRRLGLYDISHVDPSPSAHWPEPSLALDPDPDAGPVLVLSEWTVPAERATDFVAAMSRVARVRQRTGGRRWSLFQDGARPDRFLESYLVPSWAEHLRQHQERLTVTDARAESAARQLASAPPTVSHLFVPAAPD